MAGKQFNNTRDRKSRSNSGQDDNTGPSQPLTIVGIGASAGGLEAFTELLQNLPADTGMAFVFAQHFKPDHRTMLPEILARETAMPVTEVHDGTVLEPDHVYVMSAYVPIALEGNTVHVQEDHDDRARRMPIDDIFRTLAAYKDGTVVGVVLSGTASDGTLGLTAIKESNGITMAQSEESARYDGMPRSAIASGAADFVLDPSGLARELARLAVHPELRYPRVEEAIPQPNVLEHIFQLLRERFAVDFAGYKQSTVARRLKRRMVVHHLESMSGYLAYLHKSTAELDALYHDLLINVTGFFRDPEAFEALKRAVFPALVKDRDPDSALRVWVPGCSTGEEAYSLAIALLEFMEETGTIYPVQLFGTDIDDEVIARARAGIYPENLSEDLSDERLGRFFTRTTRGYEISKRIRQLCVFSRHDVVKDPPFSRLDLVSCRNLLIYLGPVLQKKVFPLIHFALKPTGYLLLGTTETVGAATDLFHLQDKKFKIYRKRVVDTPLHFEFRTPPPTPAPATAPEAEPPAPPSGGDVRREADQILIRRYAPAAVVIDKNMGIVRFRGHTGPFLEPASGEAKLNLLNMARDGLLPALRSAVAEALARDATVRRANLRASVEDRERNVSIEVVPIRGPAQRHFLVVFQQESPAPAGAPPSEEKRGEVDALEQELAGTKEYLQSVIEQYEVANEELRCANEEVQSSYEELQSANEELQSTNEELETAREELQSTNEELRTVNDELESRNTELAHVSDDLENLIASANLAVAIIGADLCIRRFSPLAKDLLNLIDTDVGRPITNIKPNLDLPELKPMVERVVNKVEPVTADVRDEQGRWYSLRVHPYWTTDNRIDGVVLALIDVDEVKRALGLADAAREHAEAIIRGVRHPMLALDRNLVVVSASEAYLTTFGVTEKETVGNLIYHLGNGQWAIPKLRTCLEDAINKQQPFDEFVVEHDFPDIGRRTMSVSGRTIYSRLEQAPLMLMQIEDVTGRGSPGRNV